MVKEKPIGNFDAVRMVLAEEAAKPGGLSRPRALEIATSAKFGFKFSFGSRVHTIDSWAEMV